MTPGLTLTPATLSDDAKVVAAKWFSEARVGRECLTLTNRHTQPTRRCRLALAELAAAKVIAVRQESPVSLARVYTLLEDCRPHARWLRGQTENQDVDFQLMERIA